MSNINNASIFEYYLNNASKLTIDSQQFSPPSTRIRGQTDTNEVTIQNSGTIKKDINDDTIDAYVTPHTTSLAGSTITVDSLLPLPPLLKRLLSTIKP